MKLKNRLASACRCQKFYTIKKVFTKNIISSYFRILG